MDQIFLRIAGFYLLAINFVALAAFGIDKRRAVKKRWRIPERTLLLFAAAGGSVGAVLGMRLFHHKTRKHRFTIGISLILAAQVLLLLVFLAFLGKNIWQTD